jgi:hypothetical protein
MIPDTTFQLHHGGDPATGPELAPEAIGFRAALQIVGQASELFGRQAARGPRWSPMAEGLRTALAGTPHPLADGRFADPHGLGNLALGPPLLLEMPAL